MDPLSTATDVQQRPRQRIGVIASRHDPVSVTSQQRRVTVREVQLGQRERQTARLRGGTFLD
jgi:hypothetical protein